MSVTATGAHAKHARRQRASGWRGGGWGGITQHRRVASSGAKPPIQKKLSNPVPQGLSWIPSGPQCCSPGRPDRDITKTGEHRDRDKIETFRIQDQDQTKSVYISKKSHDTTQQMSFYIYATVPFSKVHYSHFLSHFAGLTATVIPRYTSTFKD